MNGAELAVWLLSAMTLRDWSYREFWPAGYAVGAANVGLWWELRGRNEQLWRDRGAAARPRARACPDALSRGSRRLG